MNVLYSTKVIPYISVRAHEYKCVIIQDADIINDMVAKQQIANFYYVSGELVEKFDFKALENCVNKNSGRIVVMMIPEEEYT